MLKSILVVASLAIASTATFAQPASPQGASAPAKPNMLVKMKQQMKAAKARHPPTSAVNPEATPDKKGGN